MVAPTKILKTHGSVQRFRSIGGLKKPGVFQRLRQKEARDPSRQKRGTRPPTPHPHPTYLMSSGGGGGHGRGVGGAILYPFLGM